jgi:hypothetical protein
MYSLKLSTTTLSLSHLKAACWKAAKNRSGNRHGFGSLKTLEMLKLIGSRRLHEQL